LYPALICQAHYTTLESFITNLSFSEAISAKRFLIKTFLKSFRRGTGDSGLFTMASPIYGIVMLVAAIDIPGAMIKI